MISTFEFKLTLELQLRAVEGLLVRILFVWDEHAQAGVVGGPAGVGDPGVVEHGFAHVIPSGTRYFTFLCGGGEREREGTVDERAHACWELAIATNLTVRLARLRLSR
jgi:hypothetical protein